MALPSRSWRRPRLIKGILKSGFKRVDRLFARVIRTLNRKTVFIYLKPRLKFSKRSKRMIAGLYSETDCGAFEIFISTSKTANFGLNEKVSTLCHEALHIIFPNKKEKTILALEDLLWRNLTYEQRKLLKSFIPHYRSGIAVW